MYRIVFCGDLVRGGGGWVTEIVQESHIKKKKNTPPKKCLGLQLPPGHATVNVIHTVPYSFHYIPWRAYGLSGTQSQHAKAWKHFNKGI